MKGSGGVTATVVITNTTRPSVTVDSAAIHVGGDYDAGEGGGAGGGVGGGWRGGEEDGERPQWISRPTP